jgi:hypothetical protein
MYTGVCQNRHILFFLHKALTFSSQGFLFSKVFVICCAAKDLPDSNNPFYDSFSSPLLPPLPSSTTVADSGYAMLRTPPDRPCTCHLHAFMALLELLWKK